MSDPLDDLARLMRQGKKPRIDPGCTAEERPDGTVAILDAQGNEKMVMARSVYDELVAQKVSASSR